MHVHLPEAARDARPPATRPRGRVTPTAHVSSCSPARKTPRPNSAQRLHKRRKEIVGDRLPSFRSQMSSAIAAADDTKYQ